MSTNAVNAVNVPVYEGSQTTTNPPVKAGSEQVEFMDLLMAQLQNQNPLEPVSDEQFMSQITQINSLTELQGMNGKMSTLEDISQSLSLLVGMENASTSLAGILENLLGEWENPYNKLAASSLIGKTVELVDEEGATVSGVVSSVSFQEDQTWVTVDGTEYLFSSVVKVE